MEVNIINLSLWTQAKPFTKFVLFNGTTYPCTLSYLSQWSWQTLFIFFPSNSFSTLSSHFIETLLAMVMINLHIFIFIGQFSVFMKNPLDTFQSYSDLIHILCSIDLFLLPKNYSFFCFDMTFSWFFS